MSSSPPEPRYVTAPGTALITRCPECEGGPCQWCDGTGYCVWKACPNCGDTREWEYFKGDTPGVLDIICWACRVSWSKDDPRWVIQVLPEGYH